MEHERGFGFFQRAEHGFLVAWRARRSARAAGTGDAGADAPEVERGPGNAGCDEVGVGAGVTEIAGSSCGVARCCP